MLQVSHFPFSVIVVLFMKVNGLKVILFDITMQQLMLMNLASLLYWWNQSSDRICVQTVEMKTDGVMDLMLSFTGIMIRSLQMSLMIPVVSPLFSSFVIICCSLDPSTLSFISWCRMGDIGMEFLYKGFSCFDFLFRQSRMEKNGNWQLHSFNCTNCVSSQTINMEPEISCLQTLVIIPLWYNRIYKWKWDSSRQSPSGCN